MNIYLEAFSIFFKIGAFTIGGGYAMVAMPWYLSSKTRL